MTSRSSLRQIERRIKKREQRARVIEITPVPIVTIAHWAEEERAAFLASTGGEPAVIISLHPEIPVEPVEPVTPPPVPTPNPQPEPDPIANIEQELAERERVRAEAEWKQGIPEREARRARWF